MDMFDPDHGLIKFVKVNNEYRFASKYQNHKSLVKENEVVQSAGSLCYDTNADDSRFMRMMNEPSMTLKWLGPDDEDGPNIAKLLNYELKDTRY